MEEKLTMSMFASAAELEVAKKVQAAVLAERERAAQIAERWVTGERNDDVPMAIAAAIRQDR